MWFARSQELTECYLGSSANAGSIRAQPAFPGFPPNSSAVLRGTGQPAHAGPVRCLCHCDLNHQPSAEFTKQAQDKRQRIPPEALPCVPRGALLLTSWGPLGPFFPSGSLTQPRSGCGLQCRWAVIRRMLSCLVCCPLHLAPGCSLVDPVRKGLLLTHWETARVRVRRVSD